VVVEGGVIVVGNPHGGRGDNIWDGVIGRLNLEVTTLHYILGVGVWNTLVDGGGGAPVRHDPGVAVVLVLLGGLGHLVLLRDVSRNPMKKKRKVTGILRNIPQPTGDLVPYTSFSSSRRSWSLRFLRSWSLRSLRFCPATSRSSAE